MDVGQTAAKALSAFGAGRFDEAAELYAELTRRFPESAEWHFNRAAALVQAGKLPEAEKGFASAIAADGSHQAAHYYLGLTLESIGDTRGMIQQLERFVSLAGEHGPALYRIGRGLLAMGEPSAATPYLERAARTTPENELAHADLGLALYSQGHYEKAIESLDRAIGLSPEMAEAHWNKALCLLLLGQYEWGWKEFEWRKQIGHLKPARPFVAREWSGEDLSGKTILLHAEGGHGDAIFFSRYVPRIAERGARVIVECHSALVSLFRSLRGVSEVIEGGKEIPNSDFEALFNSLPMIFGTTLNTIDDRVPYLSPRADLISAWAERLKNESGLRVGLCWAGSDQGKQENRSRTIDVYAPLANVTGVQFISLQKGNESAQQAPAGMKLMDLTSEIEDFESLGALIENLDLVISVDTAVAHLAGALGKKVWTLLPVVPDFRWMVEREDSPWYPTMRLFRQVRRGNWDEPVMRMKEELEVLTKESTSIR